MEHTGKQEPVRILHVVAGPIVKRGVEKYLLNLYRSIDRRAFQFDCVTPSRCYNEEFRHYFDRMGGELVELGGPDTGLKRYFVIYKAIRRCLKKVPVNIIHISTGDLKMLAAASLAARRGGCPIIIAHTHNTSEERLKNKLVRFACTPILDHCPTHYLACSENAFRWSFPHQNFRKEKVMANAIDPELFRFEPERRRAMREALGIDDCFVIGHVGAFTRQKNHGFLLEIFEQYHKQDPAARLLLIGEGELLEQTKQRARDLGIFDAVLFAGTTDRVRDVMQAMDFFLLPSLFEGLGIVAVEAQAAGLPTLTSDALPAEVKLTASLEMLSLEEPPEEWARQIRRLAWTGFRREDGAERITAAGYDTRSAAKTMERFYSRVLRNLEFRKEAALENNPE